MQRRTKTLSLHDPNQTASGVTGAVHIIALTRYGRSIEIMAREFEPRIATIHLWLKEAQLESAERDDVVTSAEREYLKRLHRENKVLRKERDILSKAVAWFAQGEAPSLRCSGP